MEATCMVGNVPNDNLAVSPEYFSNLIVLKFSAKNGTSFYRY